MTAVKIITVDKSDADIRLDRWFKRHFPKVTHIEVEKATRKGNIRVNGTKVKAGHRIKTGDEIRVPPLSERAPDMVKIKKPVSDKYIKLINDAIIYKDADIIAINKPSGIASQGGQGVNVSVDDLLDYLKFDSEIRPKLVHRLDKDTSGVMIVARTSTAAAFFAKQFKSKEIQKIYWAIVVGVPKIRDGKIDYPLIKKDIGNGIEKVVIDDDEGQKARTYYNTIENFASQASFVELRPVTGRTHQLRVHMTAIDTPILGDGKYGGQLAFINGLSKKLHLHARSIEFTMQNGERKEVVAELTGHMKDTFDMMVEGKG